MKKILTVTLILCLLMTGVTTATKQDTLTNYEFTTLVIYELSTVNIMLSDSETQYNQGKYKPGKLMLEAMIDRNKGIKVKKDVQHLFNELNALLVDMDAYYGKRINLDTFTEKEVKEINSKMNNIMLEVERLLKAKS